MALAVRRDGGRPSLESRRGTGRRAAHEARTRTHPTSLPEQSTRRRTWCEHGARLQMPGAASNRQLASRVEPGRAISNPLYMGSSLRPAESAVPESGCSHPMRSCSYPAPLAASRDAQALPGPRTRPAVSDVSAERSDQDDHRFRHPQPRPVSSPSRRLANEKSSQSDTRIGACRAGWPTAALRSARVHHDLLRLRPRVGAPALMSFGSAGCGPPRPGGAARDHRGGSRGHRTAASARRRRAPRRSTRGVPRSSRIRPGAGARSAR